VRVCVWLRGSVSWSKGEKASRGDEDSRRACAFSRRSIDRARAIARQRSHSPPVRTASLRAGRRPEPSDEIGSHGGSGQGRGSGERGRGFRRTRARARASRVDEPLTSCVTCSSRLHEQKRAQTADAQTRGAQRTGQRHTHEPMEKGWRVCLASCLTPLLGPRRGVAGGGRVRARARHRRKG